ncbi:hypothetical protein C5B89_12095 [Haloferax sp. Atlit-47N]|uniref:hypothetical protein n=1 Tax=Haloferax sp. Atlit-47N TaxID=2077199 RepID=UPI000E238CD5|nr:hypothetical protein [Haloferax sp. Atlit-47N]RDZ39258.1 hypothetical protein C5B89_12095 [Haloferax sp. Atlit-47N]
MRIYLDQNKWINLLQEREGDTPDHYPDFSDALEFVEEHAQNDSVVFPIDSVRLQEAAARGDSADRSMLYDYLWEISGGWGYAPFSSVMVAECREAVRCRAGMGDQLEDEVFGRGIAHIEGAPLHRIRHESGEWLLDQIDDEDVDLAYEIAQSYEMYNDHISGDGLEGLRELHDTRELAEMLEGWDKEIRKEYADTDRQRRVSMVKHYVQIILPEFLEWWTQVGFHPLSHPVSPEDWNEYVRRGRDAETAESFLREFGFHYCFNELRFRRGLEGMGFSANDVRDLQALSIAIPYSDIVVCEKHFGNLALQSNLDEVFDTTILTDLSDLPAGVER